MAENIFLVGGPFDGKYVAITDEEFAIGHIAVWSLQDDVSCVGRWTDQNTKPESVGLVLSHYKKPYVAGFSPEWVHKWAARTWEWESGKK